MNELLHLSGVFRSYGRALQTHVLHDVNLRIEPGEFVALVGPSGSGKTTLLNILGLLDRPTRGTVLVRGIDTCALDEAALTRFRGETLGFVFQFHHLIPSLTAEENVMLPLALRDGGTSAAGRARARELLAQVGLDDRARHRANALSGGQQQRVAIARALALRPPLVLADEPTGNLDSRAGEDVLGILRAANEQDGTAFVIVTHDARLADRCDRTVTIADGRITRDTGLT